MSCNSCLSSRRCRGIIVRSRYKVYWKSLKNDLFDGFYFFTKPKGGFASNNSKSLYPEEQSLEWKRALRFYHGKYFGSTYNKNSFNKSTYIGTGDIYHSKLLPPPLTEECIKFNNKEPYFEKIK